MKTITRRGFLKAMTTTGVAVAGVCGTIWPAGAASDTRRRMTICLSGGAIGVSGNQREMIELAHRFGFESVEASGDFLARLSEGEMAALQQEMKAAGIVFGAAGLPVDFRGDEARFQSGIKVLPAVCAGLQRANVDRIGTWLSPGHASLTYLANLRQHARRLGEVASVLKGHGLRLGLEYVGTPSARSRAKYPFIHSMAETKDLIAEIGADNVGFVLDSWHWWTAGDSVDDIRSLTNGQVVSVDLNDAPSGIRLEDQQDGRRELPAATGVIDVKSFLQALHEIGYDGPVRAEPFNRALNALTNDGACAATIAAMKQAFALAFGG